MKKSELLQFRKQLEKFCKAEKELIKLYPTVFCDRDFDRMRSILQFMNEIQ